MKKQIFTKLFALFLVGGLLTTVGCKDYDDDIDALNKDVSDLKGEVVKINDLDARIKAVKATADATDAAFKAINFDQYVTDAELKTKLDQLVKDEQAHLATVLAGYATSQQLADAKTALENSIKAKTTLAEAQAAIMAKVAEELKKYAEKDASYTKAQMDKMLKDLKAEIIAQFPVVDNTANLWLGSDFGKYLKSFTSEAAFKTAIGGVASDAVLADLKNANSAFTAELNQIFTDKLTAFEGADGTKVIRKADLDTALAKYNTAIANLWSAVGNLAGRIQSLVYVPKYAVDDHIVFDGYELGDDASAPKLTENVSAEMAFRVSPASLAESLVKGYAAGTVKMSFIPEEVIDYYNSWNARAEEQELVKIESVSYDPTAPGKIMIRATSHYDYVAGDRADKTLSIALCIKDSKLVGDKEDIETGIEFTSEYQPTDGGHNDVLNNFVQAKAKADKTFTEYATQADYALEYNDLVTKVELMKDYELMYKDGAEYLTLAEAQAKFHWDVTPALVFAHTAVVRTIGAGQLAVTPGNPLEDAKTKATPVVIKNGAKDKISATNIDKTYTLTTDVSLKVGEETVAMAEPEFISVLTLTRKALANIDLSINPMTWKYAKFNTAADYATAEITLKAGALTAAQFKALDLTNGWNLDANEGSIAVDGITVVGEKISTPSTDSDAQILKFTVQGYELGDLNMKIKKSILVGDGESINIAGTIVINGLPKEVAAYDVSKALTYAGVSQNLPVSKADMVAALEKLINTNKFFAAGEFATAFGKTDPNAPALTSAPVTLDGDAGATAQLALKADHSAVLANFADVNFVKQPMLTYAVDGAANYIEFLGVTIPLTGTITFKGSDHKLKPGGNLIDVDTNPYSLVYGKVTGNTFALNAIKLSDSYTAAGAGLAVEYKVNKAAEFTGTMPTIDGDGVTMAWGECGLAKVSVTALLKYNGTTVDQKDFEVRLVQPVNYDSFGARLSAGKPVSNEVKVIPNETPASMNVYSLMSMVDRQLTPAQIFTATGISTLASQATGYGMTVTFEKPVFAPEGVDFKRIHFDTTTGVFTVDQNQSALAGTVTATVKVTMTDSYTNELNADGDNTQPTKIVKSVVVKFVPATK